MSAASSCRAVLAPVPVTPPEKGPCSHCEWPAEWGNAVWRGNQFGRSVAKGVSTGFAALDAELPGGGWPCACLVEILQAHPSQIEWRLVGPSLPSVARGGRPVVLIGPPAPPHGPGLRHLGVEASQLVWIQAETASERLWCAEQLIRSNAAAALLLWLPQARPEQLRRLQVLAPNTEGVVFVFRPAAARHDPSPAPLRLLASPLVDWMLEVQVLKRKGPAHDGRLHLPSVPGGLEHVLTPRTRRPSLLVPAKEAPRHVVGRPAAAVARPAATVLG